MPGDLYRFKDVSDNDVKLFINDREQKLKLVNGYAVITRRWKSGTGYGLSFRWRLGSWLPMKELRQTVAGLPFSVVR
ncbi:MAG: hypothetical protein R2744_11960 [Bacteroidales bacterium]